LRKRIGKRWPVLVAFGVLFAALFAIVGVADGIGHPSVPSGDVAVVEDAPNGTVTKADFDAALAQAAAQQGLSKPPSPSSPQYASLHDSAMAAVLQSRWIQGEAADRGITLSNTEISQRLQQLQKQIGTRKKFQQYIKQAGYTPQQARDQIEVTLLGTQIQQQVVPQTATVPDSLVTEYYDANKAQFSQPETRDVRQIVNKDQAKVQSAKAQLEKDSSSKSWSTAAAKYSTDKATNHNGGLSQGVTKGQSGDPTVDQEIFSAAQGALVGPFKAQNGYYLIQVQKVTPASTTPLSKVGSQIKQQLSQGVQQEAVNNLRTDFIAKWSQRTTCAGGYVMQLCRNYTPPVQTTPGAPPVASSAAVNPGHAATFPGQAPQALPQGPQFPAPKAAGIIGPSGAPTLPPGAAPQGAAPQTAPPQTAPPQTAPPQTAPPQTAPPSGG
jgi:parvulin-like peptidyl-prolyl isomerase